MRRPVRGQVTTAQARTAAEFARADNLLAEARR